RRLRIFRRTRVWPPRAVGVFTSASRQENGVLSSSNKVLFFTLIASINTAINSSGIGRHRWRMQTQCPFPLKYRLLHPGVDDRRLSTRFSLAAGHPHSSLSSVNRLYPPQLGHR